MPRINILIAGLLFYGASGSALAARSNDDGLPRVSAKDLKQDVPAVGEVEEVVVPAPSGTLTKVSAAQMEALLKLAQAALAKDGKIVSRSGHKLTGNKQLHEFIVRGDRRSDGSLVLKGITLRGIKKGPCGVLTQYLSDGCRDVSWEVAIRPDGTLQQTITVHVDGPYDYANDEDVELLSPQGQTTAHDEVEGWVRYAKEFL